MLSMMDLLKKSIRLFVSALLYYTGLFRFWSLIFRRGPIILTYHRVLDSPQFKTQLYQPGMVVSVETFEKQMEFLKKNYSVISLDHLIDWVKKRRSIKPRSVVITFDDGWRDNFTNAYPVLRKYELPAVIFLTTDYVDTRKWFWPEKLISILKFISEESLKVPIPDWLTPSTVRELLNDALKSRVDRETVDKLVEDLKTISEEERDKLLYYLVEKAGISLDDITSKRISLNWDEVGEMNKNGVAMGSHSQTHSMLIELSDLRIEAELRESKKRIERHLETPCLSFAYPYGGWNDRVRKLVVEAGYVCAFTLRDSDIYIDPYLLPRINVHEDISTGVGGKFSKYLFDAVLNRFLM